MTKIDTYIKKLDGPILILGASGFVGSQLFKKIFQFREDVYALTKNGKNWRLEDVPNENIFTIDLIDINHFKFVFDKINPLTIFDCMSYGAYHFEENADLIYETNLIAFSRILDFLNNKKISSYIHAGSSSEYGLNSSAPVENSTLSPNSHYSVSKVAAGALIKFYGKTLGFPIINLRIYSVYGPYEEPARLIPNVIEAAIQKKFPPFVNKNISRDFIFIDDVINAFLCSSIYLSSDSYGESYNIGTGNKTTIESFSYLVKDVFKIKQNPKFSSRKNNKWDLSDWYANPKLFKKKFHWKPLVSLEEGLKKTFDWRIQHKNINYQKESKLFKKEKKSITAIVACYKDEDAIIEMHSRLTSVFLELKVNYKIIYVNDNSPDDSFEVIKKISKSDSSVIGINHSRNFGSQMAFRSGMEIADSDAVVLLDGDLQDPPEVITEFYEKWNLGFDVVYGERVKREMPFFMDLIYKLFYRVFTFFSYIKIPHDAGDFSLIDKKAVNWILQCNEKDLFVRGIRAYVGFKQIGVKYIRPERKYGKSTNSFLKNIEWAKKGIFSFSNLPLSVMFNFGFLLFSISIIISLVVILLKIIDPESAPKGITLILLSGIFFGSMNFFAAGILGEYISKILLEVKNRPPFIKKSLIKNGNEYNVDNIK